MADAQGPVGPSKLDQACELGVFFVLCCVCSYSAWGCNCMLALGWLDDLPVLMQPLLVKALDAVGRVGPALAAVAGVVLYDAPVLDLLARALRLRSGFPAWHAFSLAVPPALVASALLLQSWAADVGVRVWGHRVEAPALGPMPAASEVATVFAVSVACAFLEELGWRGYATPRAQQLLSGLSGSLLVGTLWALWQAPLFAYSPLLKTGGGLAELVEGLFFFVCAHGFVSVLLSWAANATQGTFCCMLFTASLHTAIAASGLRRAGPFFFFLASTALGLVVLSYPWASTVPTVLPERLAPSEPPEAKKER